VKIYILTHEFLICIVVLYRRIANEMIIQHIIWVSAIPIHALLVNE